MQLKGVERKISLKFNYIKFLSHIDNLCTFQLFF